MIVILCNIKSFFWKHFRVQFLLLTSIACKLLGNWMFVSNLKTHIDDLFFISILNTP